MAGYRLRSRRLSATSSREHTSSGLVRLFFGAILTKEKGVITFNAFPYWDVQRQAVAVRRGVFYRHEVRRFHGE